MVALDVERNPDKGVFILLPAKTFGLTRHVDGRQLTLGRDVLVRDILGSLEQNRWRGR